MRELQQVGNTAERELGKATSSTDKFAAGAVRAGTVMVGAAAVIGVGLASTVRSALESERANLLLSNTIQKMPALAGANKSAFLAQATALQKVTVASDEQIISAQAMLGTFQLTQKEILGITPLVVDFARKFGVDVVEASKQVGKALEGQIGALKRQGVSIDENLYKTDRYAAVLKALREQAGGFAENEGKTFEGQLQILSNQADEFKESIGRGVVGVLTDVLPAATGAANALGSFDEATGNTVGQIAILGTVSLGAVGGLLVVAGATAKVKTAFDAGGIAAGRFGTAIKGIGTATAAVGGILIVADLLDRLTGNSEKAADALSKITRATEGAAKVKAFSDEVSRLQKGMKEVDKVSRIGDITGLWTPSFDRAKVATQQFNKQLKESPSEAQALVDSLKAAGEKTYDFQKRVDEAVAAKKRDAEISERDASATDRLGDAYETAEEKTRRHADAVVSTTATLTGVVSAQLAWESAIRAMGEAQNDYLTKQAEADAAGGRNIELNNAATAALFRVREQINATALAEKAKAEFDAGPKASAEAKAIAGNDAYRASLQKEAQSDIPAVAREANNLLLILAAFEALNPMVTPRLNTAEFDEGMRRLNANWDVFAAKVEDRNFFGGPVP